MKDYPNIVSAFYGSAWMIMLEAFEVMDGLLRERLAGIKLTEEEVRERLDGKAYGMNRPGQGLKRDPTPSIAVIPLHGPIVSRAGMMQQMSGMTSPQSFAAAVRDAADDPKVSEIVLDIDSPGGTVSGTHDAAEAVRYATGKKRVTAVANDMMASAAYYIGAQANRIVALPSSALGSISVLAAHLDLTEAEKALGVKRTILRTGSKKALGHPSEALSPEAKAELMAELQKYHNVFVDAVAMGRGKESNEVQEEWADGSIFLGQEALEAGLADEIGTLDGTIAGILGGDSESVPQVKVAATPEQHLDLRIDTWDETPEKEEAFMPQSNNDRPDLTGLPDNVVAYINSLEAEAGEQEPAIDTSTLPKVVQERLEALERQAAEAQATADREREARLTKEYLDRASEFSHIGAPKALATMLREAEEKMTPEAFTEFERTMRSANEVAKSSRLFEAIGVDEGGSDNSVEAELNERARKIMSGTMTLEAAQAKVLEEDPALYERIQKSGRNLVPTQGR